MVGIILLLWYIFGNSPTELAIILTFALTILLKVWSISDNLKDFQYKTSLSFHKVRGDINNINNRLIKLEDKRK